MSQALSVELDVGLVGEVGWELGGPEDGHGQLVLVVAHPLRKACKKVMGYKYGCGERESEGTRTLTGSVSFTTALPCSLCEVMSTWGPCRGESWFSVGARELEDMVGVVVMMVVAAGVNDDDEAAGARFLILKVLGCSGC